MNTRLRVTAWVGLVVSVISVVLVSIVGGPARYPVTFVIGLITLAFGGSALVQSATLLWPTVRGMATDERMRWSSRLSQAVAASVGVTALMMLGLAVAAGSVEGEARILGYAGLALVSALSGALLVHFIHVRWRSEQNL